MEDKEKSIKERGKEYFESRIDLEYPKDLEATIDFVEKLIREELKLEKCVIKDCNEKQNLSAMCEKHTIEFIGDMTREGCEKEKDRQATCQEHNKFRAFCSDCIKTHEDLWFPEIRADAEKKLIERILKIMKPTNMCYRGKDTDGLYCRKELFDALKKGSDK